MCAVLAAVSRQVAFPGHQVRSLELAHDTPLFGTLFPLVLFLLTVAARPRPAAAASQAQNTRDRLEWGVPPFFAAARGRGKKPNHACRGNPPDQLSTISLLLLVEPEVTDIERRAMETSL